MPIFATGHVRAPNKDHLIALKHAQHGALTRSLRSVSLPSSFDARTLGIIPPIEDQADCGSCWDFSGTGVVDIAYLKAGQSIGPFSTQYTLSCGKNGGCMGDDNVTVLDWAKATGLPTTAAYGPYTGSGGGMFGSSCKWSSSMSLYKIDSWGFSDGNGGNGVTPTADIKASIFTYGCVGIGIAANNAFMNMSPGTVFKGKASDINHDVILVGWDDSKGTAGAWILRNSWGTSWCDQGYCWIEYGANDVGTEAVWAQVGAAPSPTPPPTPAPTPGPTPTPPDPAYLPNVPLTALWIDKPSKSYHNAESWGPTVANNINPTFVVHPNNETINVPKGWTEL